ncbi:MAG: tetratricopeptide repeat protein [bacterium]|nr:tetratricopeptide repeat protein [bacterium]
MGLERSGQFWRIDKAALKETLAQCETQGLLKQEWQGGYAMQPVLPLFLGQRVKEQGLFSSHELDAVEYAFCYYMTVLAKFYKELLESKELGRQQAGLRLFNRERENLYKALHLNLDQQRDFFPLFILFVEFYSHKNLISEATIFTERVLKKLKRYTRYATREGKFLVQYGYVVGNLGTYYELGNNRAAAAKFLNESLALLQETGKHVESAMVYHRLGYLATEERDYVEAKKHYREAIRIFQKYYDRAPQAVTYHQLGVVAYEEDDYPEAEKNYKESLKIDGEFNDRASQAKTYRQLGSMAQDNRDFAKAKTYYRQALTINRDFNDRKGLADIYHKLGSVATEERDFAEAKIYLREALILFQELPGSSRVPRADIYFKLGVVAFEEHDFAEAGSYYREALKLRQELNSRSPQGTSTINWAGWLLKKVT